MFILTDMFCEGAVSVVMLSMAALSLLVGGEVGISLTWLRMFMRISARAATAAAVAGVAGVAGPTLTFK